MTQCWENFRWKIKCTKSTTDSERIVGDIEILESVQKRLRDATKIFTKQFRRNFITKKFCQFLSFFQYQIYRLCFPHIFWRFVAREFCMPFFGRNEKARCIRWYKKSPCFKVRDSASQRLHVQKMSQQYFWLDSTSPRYFAIGKNTFHWSFIKLISEFS